MLDYKRFTSYYPVSSQLHKTNPIIKLLCLLLLLVSIILTSEVKLVVFMLFLTFVLMYYSKVPLRFYLDIIYGMRYIYILLLLYLGMKGLYLEETLMLYFKITIVMLYLALVLYTTSSKELKYGLEKIINPLNILKINFSPFINSLVNIITFFPTLFITEKEVLIASSSRGLDYIHADVLSRVYVVLVNLKNTFRLTFERLEKEKLNAFLRGYSTNKYRTILSVQRVGFLGIIMLLSHIIFVAYVIWERIMLWDI